MSLNRWAKRRDANEPDVVKELEAIGCTVFRLDQPADLLVGFRGLNLLVEVKDGSKPPSQRELTDAQAVFSSEWRGQWLEAKTPHEAVQAVLEASDRFLDRTRP